WNTTLAEIKCGLQLQLAINYWIEQLDAGLTGKKKLAAKRHKKQLSISFENWDLLASVVEILQKPRDITLQLSHKDIPTILMLLLLYKDLEVHIKS
ncbi:hypothetical protein C8Q74DRAFT_1185403, partial [Fomes fomentarius]